MDYLEPAITVIGWVVAFSIAAYQTVRAYRTSIEEQDRLFRQKIQYDAYQALDAAAQDFSQAQGQVDTAIRMLTMNLSLASKTPLWQPPPWQQTLVDLNNRRSASSAAFVDFLRTFESFEIALPEFGRVRDRLFDTHVAAGQPLDRLVTDFISTPPVINGASAARLLHRLSPSCDAYLKLGMDLQGYLFDLRIALQNEILGPVFGRRVAKRQPQDPGAEVLTADTPGGGRGSLGHS